MYCGDFNCWQMHPCTMHYDASKINSYEKMLPHAMAFALKLECMDMQQRRIKCHGAHVDLLCNQVSIGLYSYEIEEDAKYKLLARDLVSKYPKTPMVPVDFLMAEIARLKPIENGVNY